MAPCSRGHPRHFHRIVQQQEANLEPAGASGAGWLEDQWLPRVGVYYREIYPDGSMSDLVRAAEGQANASYPTVALGISRRTRCPRAFQWMALGPRVITGVSHGAGTCLNLAQLAIARSTATVL